MKVLTDPFLNFTFSNFNFQSACKSKDFRLFVSFQLAASKNKNHKQYPVGSAFSAVFAHVSPSNRNPDQTITSRTSKPLG